MSTDNEYHLITFDPGSAATGWTWFCVDFRAFSRPGNDLYDWIKWWDCGEFRGSHFKIVQSCVDLIAEGLEATSYLKFDVVCEGFELTQTIGGDNLLSPVTIGSVIQWECHKRTAKFQFQSRSLRTSVTRARLALWGFEGKWRKDEFAAMQHAIVWLRNMKKQSRQRPWKLMEGGVFNRLWDCACRIGADCDIWHPQDR